MTTTYTTHLGSVGLEVLAAVYDGAREQLTQHGWCQGVPVDALGRLCTVGALGKTTGVWDHPTTVEGRRLYLQACDYLRKRVLPKNRSGWSVADWNDAIGRTVDDVLALLSEASARIRADLLLTRVSAADSATTTLASPASVPVAALT